MAKREPRSIVPHHIWFAAGCVLLLLTTLWAFYDDHFCREYIEHQSSYQQAEQARLKEEAEAIKSELDDVRKSEEGLWRTLWEAQNKREEKRAHIRECEAEIKRVRDQLDLLLRRLNFAGTDVGVYVYEESIGKKTLEEVEKQKDLQRELFNQVEQLKGEVAKQQAAIDEIEQPVKDAQKALDTFYPRLDELALALKKVRGNPLINAVADAPGIDIVAPHYNLNDQKIIANLPVDVKFAKAPRYDRCMSCHKAIDNPDPKYRERDPAKLPPVLRSHPRLDLFVGADAKHAVKDFGCTICHQGRSMGVSFIRAGHTPNDGKQKKEWEEKYHWDTMDHHKPAIPLWDYPMLPMKYIEASCAKCHHGVDRVPEAHKLNAGRELFREKGCVNCHIGTSDPDMAWMGRVGPDLRRIGEKTDLAWTRQWIENPWNFRPNTRMPRIFGLENRTHEPDALRDVKHPEAGRMPRDPVEIEAISTYLFASSALRERALTAPPPGDPAKGKQLFESVGCLGCHATLEAKDKFNFNEHGPDLSRVGEKLKPAWLFQWLKNPHEYWAESRMPSLRLSDAEAADLTAFLVAAMKKQGATAAAADPRPAWTFDAIIRELLKASTPDAAIEAALADPAGLVKGALQRKVRLATQPGQTKAEDSGQGEWTENQIAAVLKALDAMGGGQAGAARVQKAFYTGQALIQHYNCYACHNIQGWTYAPLACVNLQGEADKDVNKFAFGKSPIPQTRWDWFYTKIARPRVFDRGTEEVVNPYDRLKMPWFGYQKVPGADAHKEHAHAPSDTARAASGGGAEHLGDLTAAGNADATTSYGLTHEQVELLVTVLMSYTAEEIPIAMQKRPTAKDVATDRGERVIQGLNCTGCHLAGVEKPVAQWDGRLGEWNQARRGLLPLEALLTFEAQKAAAQLGIFSDQDHVSLDHPAAGATAFLNFGRGTYITQDTARILLGEKLVRRNALEPWRRLEFSGFLKPKDAAKRKDKERWVPYGALVSEKRFADLTRILFQDKPGEMEKVYKKYAELCVDKDAYERLAGSAAFRAAPEGSEHRIGVLRLDELRAAGVAWDPVELPVRWTKGEGRIVPHMLQLAPEPTQQFAPPSLAFEGGKVQPDWFYSFLRNVQTIRPGLAIRMPSFWAGASHHASKAVYPAGRLSALLSARRPTGLDAEPVPGAEVPAQVPDDARELVEYFAAIAGESPFGFQPVAEQSEKSRKSYEQGLKLLFPPAMGGLGCTQCHIVGDQIPATLIGPNLARVKWRFKEAWLHRFMTSPASIYPWTKMPSNFYDWGAYETDPKDPLRGIKGGDMNEFKDFTGKLNDVELYLRNAGEIEGAAK